MRECATHKHLERTLAARGLRLRGGFVPTEADGLPALPGGATPAVVWLVGQVGSEIWPHFSATQFLRDGLPDPLDRWSKTVGNDLANTLVASPSTRLTDPPGFHSSNGQAAPSRWRRAR